MSTYSIENDKRIQTVGLILAFSVIIYYCIDYYILTPYKPNDALFGIIFFFLPVTSFGIAWIITISLKPIIFKVCKIKDNSGIYEGFLKSSTPIEESENPIKITIKQTLFEMNIELTSKVSCSINNTAHVGSGEKGKITYTYENEGSVENLDLKIHRGTCVITIFEGKLTGRYYNDPHDRGTFGSLELKKISP